MPPSMPTPYPLSPIPYSLFPIPYSLFPTPYSLHPIFHSLPESRRDVLGSGVQLQSVFFPISPHERNPTRPRPLFPPGKNQLITPQTFPAGLEELQFLRGIGPDTQWRCGCGAGQVGAGQIPVEHQNLQRPRTGDRFDFLTAAIEKHPHLHPVGAWLPIQVRGGQRRHHLDIVDSVRNRRAFT
ncbi:MAG TPA: hypothetical protein ENH84_02955, partial [Phycisphaerae bacterium]|nr:hypothetical protein [Phycisphaerae bacterium]